MPSPRAGRGGRGRGGNGGVVIMAGYLVGDASRWFTGVGLACILGGLWFATKWE